MLFSAGLYSGEETREERERRERAGGGVMGGVAVIWSLTATKRHFRGIWERKR